ncbi:hypothetical protein CYMTET_9226 [Cymbomonas tetramitiformis]|uniref:Uncharacterized protein n=1 Tax=Cymbomonas tetramitiformis TaxID=36881 RepID=A0AAE0GRQ5_9CHLO|nr:hypothetical protein CYMTET_9226 [Cymbomonas tetramitiformis]
MRRSTAGRGGAAVPSKRLASESVKYGDSTGQSTVWKMIGGVVLLLLIAAFFATRHEGDPPVAVAASVRSNAAVLPEMAGAQNKAAPFETAHEAVEAAHEATVVDHAGVDTLEHSVEEVHEEAPEDHDLEMSQAQPQTHPSHEMEESVPDVHSDADAAEGTDEAPDLLPTEEVSHPIEAAEETPEEPAGSDVAAVEAEEHVEEASEEHVEEASEEHLEEASEEHLEEASEEHLEEASEEHLEEASEEHAEEASEEHLEEAVGDSAPSLEVDSMVNGEEAQLQEAGDEEGAASVEAEAEKALLPNLLTTVKRASGHKFDEINITNTRGKGKPAVRRIPEELRSAPHKSGIPYEVQLVGLDVIIGSINRMQPAFTPSKQRYRATLPNNIGTYMLNIQTKFLDADVYVDGQKLMRTSLNEGLYALRMELLTFDEWVEVAIEVKAKAQIGLSATDYAALQHKQRTVTTTYSLEVYRRRDAAAIAADDTSLARLHPVAGGEKLSLKPALKPGVSKFTLNVPNYRNTLGIEVMVQRVVGSTMMGSSVQSINAKISAISQNGNSRKVTLLLSASDPAAQIAINGLLVLGGRVRKVAHTVEDMLLKVGSNVQSIQIWSLDGTHKAYAVDVVREADEILSHIESNVQTRMTETAKSLPKDKRSLIEGRMNKYIRDASRRCLMAPSPWAPLLGPLKWSKSEMSEDARSSARSQSDNLIRQAEVAMNDLQATVQAFQAMEAGRFDLPLGTGEAAVGQAAVSEAAPALKSKKSKKKSAQPKMEEEEDQLPGDGDDVGGEVEVEGEEAEAAAEVEGEEAEAAEPKEPGEGEVGAEGEAEAQEGEAAPSEEETGTDMQAVDASGEAETTEEEPAAVAEEAEVEAAAEEETETVAEEAEVEAAAVAEEAEEEAETVVGEAEEETSAVAEDEEEAAGVAEEADEQAATSAEEAEDVEGVSVPVSETEEESGTVAEGEAETEEEAVPVSDGAEAEPVGELEEVIEEAEPVADAEEEEAEEKTEEEAEEEAAPVSEAEEEAEEEAAPVSEAEEEAEEEAAPVSEAEEEAEEEGEEEAAPVSEAEEEAEEEAAPVSEAEEEAEEEAAPVSEAEEEGEEEAAPVSEAEEEAEEEAAPVSEAEEEAEEEAAPVSEAEEEGEEEAAPVSEAEEEAEEEAAPVSEAEEEAEEEASPVSEAEEEAEEEAAPISEAEEEDEEEAAPVAESQEEDAVAEGEVQEGEDMEEQRRRALLVTQHRRTAPRAQNQRPRKPAPELEAILPEDDPSEGMHDMYLEARSSVGIMDDSGTAQNLDPTEEKLSKCLRNLKGCTHAPEEVAQWMRTLSGNKVVRENVKCLSVKRASACNAWKGNAETGTFLGSTPSLPKAVQDCTQSSSGAVCRIPYQGRVCNVYVEPARGGYPPGLPEDSCRSPGGNGLEGVIEAGLTPKMYDTCALVGGGASVSERSSLGFAIDRHDAVFRFNVAPIQQFEQFVGNRTSVRVLDAVTARGLADGTVSAWGVPPPKAGERWIFWHYRVLKPRPDMGGKSDLQLIAERFPAVALHVLSPEVVNWQLRVYFSMMVNVVRLGLAPVQGGGAWHGYQCPATMSSGMHSVLLATRLCNTVNVFGFSHDPEGKWLQDPKFYYKSRAGLKKELWNNNVWRYEGMLLRALHLSDHVALCTQ